MRSQGTKERGREDSGCFGKETGRKVEGVRGESVSEDVRCR